MTGFPVAALAGRPRHAQRPAGRRVTGRAGGAKAAEVVQAGLDLPEHALAPPVGPGPVQVTP
jgi:hypothetical protein